ncbi:MAG: NAD(P)/FAD-dependent oxidoreductase [Chloroflexota bacterium]|nr:NAD(P)/FAD-dependent oxidoreductase [Chloroflexota bacterium]
MRRVAIVGGGVTGMAAADFLSQRGVACTIYERDDTLGGLAGSFATDAGEVDGARLEKFYHHLFTSDKAMAALIEELGLGDDLEWTPSITGYYSQRIHRLTSPLDVLRFDPLPFPDRIRLGMLAILPRLVRDWKPLEEITAEEWLVRWAGSRVYEQVWAPLLRAKFGCYADRISAVWIWNKLKLRGGSRGWGQAERLGYLRGGFGRALERWENRLRRQGVDIRLQAPVEEVRITEGEAKGVVAQGRFEPHEDVLVTTAPDIFLRIAAGLPTDYRRRLARIRYLANICLVLKLKHSLGQVYWLNINDPSIPFVALVEHTNLRRPEEYGGAHLVYLSRYLDPSDPLYQMSAQELLEAYLPGLKKLFPQFDKDWVEGVWAWRERYTQPVIVRHYSQLRPPFKTPVENLWLCCMAQVYPQDRGMNYALVYGRKVAEEIITRHR